MSLPKPWRHWSTLEGIHFTSPRLKMQVNSRFTVCRKVGRYLGLKNWQRTLQTWRRHSATEAACGLPRPKSAFGSTGERQPTHCASTLSPRCTWALLSSLCRLTAWLQLFWWTVTTALRLGACLGRKAGLMGAPPVPAPGQPPSSPPPPSPPPARYNEFIVSTVKLHRVNEESWYAMHAYFKLEPELEKSWT